MANSKKKALLALGILSFIILLIGLIFFVNKFLISQNNQKTAESTIGLDKDKVENEELGNITIPDDKSIILLTAEIKNVTKTSDSVFVDIETGNSKKDKIEKKLLVFKKGQSDRFFLIKNESLKQINSNSDKPIKLTDIESVYKNLSDYKEKKIIIMIYLSPSSIDEEIKPFENYIKCNDNFYSFLIGQVSQQQNCEALSFQIYAED